MFHIQSVLNTFITIVAFYISLICIAVNCSTQPCKLLWSPTSTHHRNQLISNCTFSNWKVVFSPIEELYFLYPATKQVGSRLMPYSCWILTTNWQFYKLPDKRPQWPLSCPLTVLHIILHITLHFTKFHITLHDTMLHITLNYALHTLRYTHLHFTSVHVLMHYSFTALQHISKYCNITTIQVQCIDQSFLCLKYGSFWPPHPPCNCKM